MSLNNLGICWVPFERSWFLGEVVGPSPIALRGCRKPGAALSLPLTGSVLLSRYIDIQYSRTCSQTVGSNRSRFPLHWNRRSVAPLWSQLSEPVSAPGIWVAKTPCPYQVLEGAGLPGKPTCWGSQPASAPARKPFGAKRTAGSPSPRFFLSIATLLFSSLPGAICFLSWERGSRTLSLFCGSPSSGLPASFLGPLVWRISLFWPPI